METNKDLTKPSLNEKPVIVKDVKTAKRLLSRLISEYQTGGVNETYCKTLCYMLNVFISIEKELETQQRIEI